MSLLVVIVQGLGSSMKFTAKNPNRRVSFFFFKHLLLGGRPSLVGWRPLSIQTSCSCHLPAEQLRFQEDLFSGIRDLVVSMLDGWSPKQEGN